MGLKTLRNTLRAIERLNPKWEVDASYALAPDYDDHFYLSFQTETEDWEEKIHGSISFFSWMERVFFGSVRTLRIGITIKQGHTTLFDKTYESSGWNWGGSFHRLEKYALKIARPAIEARKTAKRAEEKREKELRRKFFRRF